ncbi:hypothetical protein diail_11619, partial [Diaporthe ilicicola]
LTSGLEAIDRTLKGRNALDLALVEDDLWRQCELALDDCHATLNSLGMLVQRIKETVRARAWAWRVRAVVNLNVYGADLAAFRDKVHKSNWALQTMLQTVNVSLSLRNNASQEAILFELDRLKSSIDEALRASVRPVGGFAHRPADHSDARVARNLRNLARAARHFHGAASSTASTIRNGSRGWAAWQAHPGMDIDVSLMGDLPSFRRERVEEYVREGRRHRRSSSSGLTSLSISPAGEHTGTSRLRGLSRSPSRPRGTHSPRPPSFSGGVESVTVPGSVIVATVEEDEDDDAEFERLFLDGLEELAKDRIKERDFDKAIEFLQEAMKHKVSGKPDNEGVRKLQVQLALCYLLQRRREMAEPIITGLAKNKAATEAVVCNLLHSVALVHLSLYQFDKALNLCREALLAKKKLLKRDNIDTDDYAQTQGLLVMIYEMRGDWMHAEVYQSQIPASFDYKHPRDEVEFVTSHPTLLATVLGDNLPDFSTPLPKVTPGLHELDGSGPDTCLTPYPAAAALRMNHPFNGASPLKVKFTQQLMYEADTSKMAYVPEPALTIDTSPVLGCGPSTSSDADDEASPTTSPEPESAVKRRLSRVFGGKRARTMRHVKVPTLPPDESVDVPACAPAKPASKPGWVNAMRGLRKSKNMFQKATHDGRPSEKALRGLSKPKEFRLLYMERMTPENAEQIDDPNYRRQYWSPESFGRRDASTRDMDAYGSRCSSPRSRNGLVTSSEDEAENGNFAFKNGVPYVDTKGLRLLRPQLENVREGNEYDSALEMTEPQPIAELSTEDVQHLEPPMLFDPYLCRSDIEVREYWNTATRGRPCGVKAYHAYHESHTPAGMDLSDTEARVSLMLEQQQPYALASPETTTSASNSSNGQKKCKKPREPVDPLFQSLSSVLASLSGISDAEGRHAVKLDLEIMALEFKRRFRDGLVNQDLQRAIDSLENDAITVPRTKDDDSGYESIGSKEAEDKGKARPVAKRSVVPKDRSPCADYTPALHDHTEKPRTQAARATNPCTSPLRPARYEHTTQSQQAQRKQLPLRKRFSFEKGDDEVVDATHAAASLRALVESRKACAVRSAIVPSAHNPFGVHHKLERASSFDVSAVKSAAAECPQVSPSAKQSRQESVVEEEGEMSPQWLLALSENEVTMQK